MNTPKYTLLYNITSSEGWVSRAIMFYNDMIIAQLEFDRLSKLGQNPLLREYNRLSDRKHIMGYETVE